MTTSVAHNDKAALWFNNPNHPGYSSAHAPLPRKKSGPTNNKAHHQADGDPLVVTSKVSSPRREKPQTAAESPKVEFKVKQEPLVLDFPTIPGVSSEMIKGAERIFEMMLQEFGCTADVGLPDGGLLDLMNRMMMAQQDGMSVKDVLISLQQAFKAYNMNNVLKELLLLLMACGTDKEFLTENGIPETAFDDAAEEDESYDEEDEQEEEDDGEWAGEGLGSKKRKRGGKKESATKKKKSSRGGGKKESKSSKRRRLRRSPDKWTPEEDDKLVELVNKYGVNTKKWRAIAEELGTSKNSAKCAQHWRRVLAPNIHKGSWTEDEEEKLLEGVKTYGLTQWTNIAREIPGRTDIQCRYHYIRQKNSREQEWNDEEDDLVRKLVEGYTGKVNWLELSDTLAASKLRRTPRTALECKQRWAVITKKGEK